MEAIESQFGAPLVATMWHPEAYLDDKSHAHAKHHENLVRFMSAAGHAYHVKKQLLKEIAAGHKIFFDQSK